MPRGSVTSTSGHGYPNQRFATVRVDERGKRIRTYRTKDYKTPYEKLKSLPDAVDLLKPGVPLEYLDQVAGKTTGRLRMKDDRCKDNIVAQMQNRIAGATALRLTPGDRGNDAVEESVENSRPVSRLSHSPPETIVTAGYSYTQTRERASVATLPTAFSFTLIWYRTTLI